MPAGTERRSDERVLVGNVEQGIEVPLTTRTRVAGGREMPGAHVQRLHRARAEASAEARQEAGERARRAGLVTIAKGLLRDIGWLIGLSLFVEVGFQLPGLGRTMQLATFSADTPLIENVLIVGDPGRGRHPPPRNADRRRRERQVAGRRVSAPGGIRTPGPGLRRPLLFH